MERYISLVSTLFIFICATYHVNAQCNNSLQFSTSDAAPMGIDGKADMSGAVSGSKIFPEYYYEIQYPKARLKYKITEFKHNQNKIYLHTWCMGQTWEQVSPSLMSQMSRTLSFKPSAGDEISFFREMWWYDENTRKLNPAIYYAGHNIGYSIELVDARSHQRLDLLDTIGFARQDIAGPPTLFASHPVMDVVKYITPKNIVADSVYLRINISITGGIENYKLYRYDTKSIDIAARDMNEQGWKEYTASAEKFNILNKPANIIDVQPILKVASEAVVNTNMTISINSEQLKDKSFIRITNSSTGSVIFSQEIGNSKEITTKITRSGVYLVSVIQNGEIAESHKILITK